MTGEETLEFRLLGPFEATVESRALALGGPRQRALLALLLLRANEVVSRDRLIEDLWRDQAPETAANALAALIARIRRALPADVVVTRSGGYEARVDTDAIDIHRFERISKEGSEALAHGDPALASERLSGALSLWRGQPLADFTYEPFAEPTILRLEELRLGAHENRIDADLALGRHAEWSGRSRPFCWIIRSASGFAVSSCSPCIARDGRRTHSRSIGRADDVRMVERGGDARLA
jgi:DNA-binding SARP family transcriptional activator